MNLCSICDDILKLLMENINKFPYELRYFCKQIDILLKQKHVSEKQRTSTIGNIVMYRYLNLSRIIKRSKKYRKLRKNPSVFLVSYLSSIVTPLDIRSFNPFSNILKVYWRKLWASEPVVTIKVRNFFDVRERIDKCQRSWKGVHNISY